MDTLCGRCTAKQQSVSNLHLCGCHSNFNKFHLTFTVHTVFDQTMF